MSLNIGARAVAETAGADRGAARDLKVANVDQAQILHRQLLATLDVLEAIRRTRPARRRRGGRRPMRRACSQDLKLALERDELTLVYQPQFDREGEAITGVETLVRWNHPTRGCVSPGPVHPASPSATA